MIYALDTNIIIRYLRKDAIVTTHVDNAIANKHKLYVPQMVDYEIRRGFSISPKPQKEAIFKLFLERCPVVKADDTTWEYTIEVYSELYKKGYTVDEMDMFIGALCVQHGYTLVTNNTKDFINISRLSLADWTK